MDATVEDDEKFFSALRCCSKFKLGLFQILLPKYLFNITRNGREMIKNLKYMENSVYKIMKKRKIAQKSRCNDDTSEKRRSLVDTIISMDQFGMEKFKSDILAFLIAGHDTTTSALVCCIYLLSRNPDVQREVYDEVKSILSTRSLPTYSDLNDLKYLHCVIKETMRLYPPAAIIGRRIAETVELSDGHVIPAGSDVYTDVYNLHYDARIYDQPYRFNPKRFMTNAKVNRGSYLTFGIGPRNCIGSKFATIEMKIMLAAFILKFEILPTEKEISIRRSYITEVRNGVSVILKLR